MGGGEDQLEPPWTGRLHELLLPAMRQRIEQLGIEQSGALNYYDVRVRRGRVFLDYELALVHRLLACGLDIRRIDEIGCGWGQLVFLLGWNGFKTVGFESNQPRFKGATALQEVLFRADAALARNTRLINVDFPGRGRPQPEPGSMVVTTNLVYRRSRRRQLDTLAAMRRYRFVLSDIQRFFDYRQDLGQEPEALALFAEAGMHNPELFLDLGAGGRYYLFTNPEAPGSGLLAALRRLWSG